MPRKFLSYFILTLFLGLSHVTLFAQDALVLGGINRIKKKNLNTENFVLIESDRIEIENGDSLKTKAKGYILIQKEGFQILIFPYSELGIINLQQNIFSLTSGKIWIENNTGHANLITAGRNQFRVINGVSFLYYSVQQSTPPSEHIQAVTIKGQAGLSSPTQNFLLTDYKKASIKNQEASLSMIPITEMVDFVNSFQSYQNLITGWNNRMIDREKFLFKPAGGLSILKSEENNYVVLSLKPQFKYKDIQFGLIFPFFLDYDNKQGYKPKNWGNYGEWDFTSFSDSLSDIILKIDFFHYGEKYQTPFYFNAGNIDRMSLKNNLIINNFRPNLNYPQTRQLNLETGFQSKYFSADGFIADCASAEIFGFRAAAKPFAENYLFKKLEIGLTSVTDLDPNTVSYGNGKDTVDFAGIDLNLPLYNFSELVTFNFNGEFAKAFYFNGKEGHLSKSAGYSYGLNGTVGDTLLYQFGGLILKDDYPDSYFDALYISQRQAKFITLTSLADGNHYGVYGNLVLDLENIFKLELNYREVLDNHLVENRPNNKFSFYFYLYPSIMDFAYIVISVDRFGIRSFSDYWNDFFTSDLTAINASLRLPFKLKYLELQLNFRRSVFIESNLTRTENSYESQIKFVF